MADKNFKYEIVEKIGVLSERPLGWNKEFNLISWNGREPKFDIREFSEDHSQMSKGVTLTHEEATILKRLLNERDDI